VVGAWRRLHNEELHNLYSSPNFIRVIKSKVMRWAEDAARMGEMRNAHKILVGKPEVINHSDDLGIDGKIILEGILGK
jgi:hypothetical protein